MNRYTLLGLVVGLIAGALIGYQAGEKSAQMDRMAAPPVAAAPAFPGMGGAPPPQAAPQGNPNKLQALQNIPMLEQLVAKDPKNHDAWVHLGNSYFDSEQPQKAIEAYGRALELKPNDPDVLTDQGVMYRSLGQFERAVDNFKKANQADPKHAQSLFNQGVVYLNDLHDAAKAKAAWQKVIDTAPNTPQAMQARDALRDLEAHPPPAAAPATADKAGKK
jgi:tetratricopeptide (TPR) repeat protein